MYSRMNSFCSNRFSISGVQNLIELMSMFIERLIRRPFASDIPRQFLNDSLISA